MFDIISVIQTVSRIILSEKMEGTRVYVNMSVCGKNAYVGVTQAAMTHDVQLYYVRTDGYAADPEQQSKHGISIRKFARLWLRVNFSFTLLDELSLLVLGFSISQELEVSCDDIIRFLVREEVSGFEVRFR